MLIFLFGDPASEAVEPDQIIDNEIIYTNTENQAQIMSNVWKKVFSKNKGKKYANNQNVKLVQDWFNNFKNNLQKDLDMQINKLEINHPITRPIIIEELNNSINLTKDKSPGATDIRITKIQLLPIKCKIALLNILNAILASCHIPYILRNEIMIFIDKPNSHFTLAYFKSDLTFFLVLLIYFDVDRTSLRRQYM